MTKPSDFFINVLDFFAVVLPGAILTALAWNDVSPVIAERLQPFGKGALSVAFAVLSYVLGQVAFAAGSLLDRSYDRFRGSKGADPLLDRAKVLASSTSGLSADALKQVSTYKWAEACVRVSNPAAAAEIDRAQAESKFFRSLSAVLIVAAIAGFLGTDDPQLLAAAGLLPFSIGRFAKLRLDATQLAYRYYAVLAADPHHPLDGESRPDPGQAGVVR